MTDRELKKLSRQELLEILIDQSKEITKLRENVQALEAKLNEQKIDVSESGSLAEAALKLNEVFIAADKAAAQYIENARLKENESIEVLKRAKEEADRIVAEAETIKARKIREGNLYKSISKGKKRDRNDRGGNSENQKEQKEEKGDLI